MTTSANKDEVRDFVRERYGEVAQRVGSGGGCGCGPSDVKEGFAKSMGYAEKDLETLPEGANLGLSCGNPVALASLKEGETVIDLGSGGGFDCFIAGRKVGPTRRIIGVDMTAEMISRARKGFPRYQELSGLANVEFRLGEIENLPVADGTADVVISNCVLNLSPDKPRVWREIARVLKPGGRVAVSDIGLMKTLPPEFAADLKLISACLAGAVTIPEMKAEMAQAGLEDIEIEPAPGGDNVWDSYQDPIVDAIRKMLPEGARIGDYAASVRVSARKAAGAASASSKTKEQPAAEAAKFSCCS